jgi:hypothetical protein
LTHPAETDRLRCPQCGGELRPLDEPGFLDCPYCGARLHQEAAPAADEWVAPILGAAQATERLRRFLESRESIGQPSFERTRLVFFPFWQRRGTHGTGLEPAAATLVEALSDWNPPFGDRRPLDEDELQRRGEVIEATLEPAKPGEPLLYVPLFEVRYRHGATEHTAWVEAVSGAVLAARVPPSRERRLDAAYAVWLAATGLALTFGFRLLWSGGGAAFIGLLLLLILGPLAVVSGRKVIRHLERGR